MKRGFAVYGVLMVLAALSVLVAVSLSARTSDLAFEGRSLCRTQARWAAESAIARGRGGRSSATGTLAPGVTYSLTTDGGRLRGVGLCTVRGHQQRVEIVARVSGGRVTSWVER